MEPEFPFEFLVFGTPLSQQASSTSKQEWKQRIREESAKKLPEMSFCYEGHVAVTIYHFPQSVMVGDVDNIVKPILDALGAHLYKDDNQVVRVAVQKFEAGQPAIFTNPSAALTEALTGPRPVTYIEISNEPFGEVA